MRILGFIVFVLLTAAGLFYAVFVSLFAGHLMTLGLGIAALVAAAIVLFFLVRRRPSTPGGTGAHSGL